MNKPLRPSYHLAFIQYCLSYSQSRRLPTCSHPCRTRLDLSRDPYRRLLLLPGGECGEPSLIVRSALLSAPASIPGVGGSFTRASTGTFSSCCRCCNVSVVATYSGSAEIALEIDFRYVSSACCRSSSGCGVERSEPASAAAIPLCRRCCASRLLPTGETIVSCCGTADPSCCCCCWVCDCAAAVTSAVLLLRPPALVA